MKERLRGCVQEGCGGCEEYGVMVEKEEERVRRWLVEECDRVEVRFERVVVVGEH